MILKLFQSQLFNQPKPFFLLFSIEFWERFGYAGLQGILAVYMVKMLKMSETDAITLFSSFTALVYALVSVGGWLGDHILGNKRMIALGAFVLAIGYGVISFSNRVELLYIGMATLAIGSGLFKSNTSATLGSLYQKDDSRLEGAYTLFYMSINIGSFFSLLITPYIASNYGWNKAFLVCFIGLLITLINYFVYQKLLDGYGSAPDSQPLNKKYAFLSGIGIVSIIAIVTWLLHHQDIARIILAIISVLVVTAYFKIMSKQNIVNKKKMLLALILMLQAIVFFVLYNQMFTSLTFFAVHNVQKQLFGINIHAEQFTALNPFWIMILSPFLAVFFTKYGKKFPITYKFATGMLFCSFAYFVLPLGAKFANSHFLVSAWWLVISYCFQCIGEIMISGLGLAMIAQLVPKPYHGFAMGSWLLTTAGANVIAGYVANLTTVPNKVLSPAESLSIYSHVFLQIGCSTLVIAIVMFIFASSLNKMQSDEYQNTVTNDI